MRGHATGSHYAKAEAHSRGSQRPTLQPPSRSRGSGFPLLSALRRKGARAADPVGPGTLCRDGAPARHRFVASMLPQGVTKIKTIGVRFGPLLATVGAGYAKRFGIRHDIPERRPNAGRELRAADARGTRSSSINAPTGCPSTTRGHWQVPSDSGPAWQFLALPGTAHPESCWELTGGEPARDAGPASAECLGP
jgi:hypothetical protein